MASSGEHEATTVVLSHIKRKQGKETLHKVDRTHEISNGTNGEMLPNNQIVNVRIKIEDEIVANNFELMDTSELFNTSMCKSELPLVSSVVKNGIDDNNAVDRHILDNMKVEIPTEVEDQLNAEIGGSNQIKTETNRTYTCEMCQTSYTEKETWRSHCSICTGPGLSQNDDGIRIAIREIPDHRIRLTSSGDRQEPGTSTESTPNAYRGAWETRGRTDRTRRALTKRKELYQKNLTRSLDSFFSAMCESAKNLPAYSQLQIKRKIFDIIKEAEESTLCMNMNGCDTTDDEAP